LLLCQGAEPAPASTMSRYRGNALRVGIPRSKQVVTSGKRQKVAKEPVLRPTIPSSEMQVGRPARLRILGDKGAGFAIAKRTTIAESRKVRKDRSSYAVPRSVPDEEEQEEQVEEERTAKATCSTRNLGGKDLGCPIADPSQKLRHASATGPTPTAALSKGARQEVLRDNVVQHPKQPLSKMEEKHSKTGMARSKQMVESGSRKRQKIVKETGWRTIPLSEAQVGLSFPWRNLGNKRAEFLIADPTQQLTHAPTTEPTPTAASSACAGEEVRQDRIMRLEHVVEQLKAESRNRTTLEERVAILEQVDKVRKSRTRTRKESCSRLWVAEMHQLKQQVIALEASQKKWKRKERERTETEKEQKTKKKKKKKKRHHSAEEPLLRGRGANEVLAAQLPDLSASEEEEENEGDAKKEEAKKDQPNGSRPTCSKSYCVRLTDAMLNGKWKHQCAHCLAMSKPKHKRKL
jgi:hypothetical protein